MARPAGMLEWPACDEVERRETGGAVAVTEVVGAGPATTRGPVRRVAAWSFLALGLVISMLGPALPGIQATFGLGMAEVGLLAVLNSGGYVISVFVGGLAADRWGRRRLLLAGTATLALSVTAFALAPSWPLALAASALVGVGSGLVDGPINALITEHSGEQRGADLNLTHAFFGFGAVAGPLLAGLLLAASLGWRWLYLPGGLLAVALAALTWRLDLGQERLTPAGGGHGRAVLAAPVVWLLAVVLCLYVGVELMIGTWAFSHLRLAFGAGDGAAGLGTALYWGGITLGRFIMGALGSRVGPHQLIVGNVVAAAVALGLLVAAPTLPLAIAALLGVGVALANIFPAVVAAGGEIYPEAAGTVSGALIAAGGLGGAVFPWLAGVVGEAAGLETALAYGIGLLAVMLVAELSVIGLQRRSPGGRIVRAAQGGRTR